MRDVSSYRKDITKLHIIEFKVVGSGLQHHQPVVAIGSPRPILALINLMTVLAPKLRLVFVRVHHGESGQG